jgi:hypothetical protein
VFLKGQLVFSESISVTDGDSTVAGVTGTIDMTKMTAMFSMT